MSKILLSPLLLIVVISMVQISCDDSSKKKTAEKSMTNMNESTEGPFIYFLVGTYTRKEGHVDGKADGIYLMTLDQSSGGLSIVDTVTGIINPSYVTIHPNSRFFYAVSEVAGSDPIGEVAAFSYDSDSHDISFINRISTEGNAPCHLSANPDGQRLYVVNYMGGIINYQLNKDGSISSAPQVITYDGGTPGSTRQEAPHPHMIQFNPTDNKVIASDLGTNELIIFESEKGQLTKSQNISMSEGAGPRHFAIHNNGKIYVLNELNNNIEVVGYFPSSDTYRVLQKINNYDQLTSPNETSSSAIKIHPNGNYLYAATRGHGNSEDSKINVFAISDVGKLSFIQSVLSRGDIPRDFEIDPSGKYLLTANQDSGSIAVFEIDLETGQLKDLNNVVNVPTPVCIKFF